MNQGVVIKQTRVQLKDRNWTHVVLVTPLLRIGRVLTYAASMIFEKIIGDHNIMTCMQFFDAKFKTVAFGTYEFHESFDYFADLFLYWIRNIPIYIYFIYHILIYFNHIWFQSWNHIFHISYILIKFSPSFKPPGHIVLFLILIIYNVCSFAPKTDHMCFITDTKLSEFTIQM